MDDDIGQETPLPLKYPQEPATLMQDHSQMIATRWECSNLSG